MSNLSSIERLPYGYQEQWHVGVEAEGANICFGY